MALSTTGDVNIVGGTVDARDALTIHAGGNLDVRSTTRSNSGIGGVSTNQDKIAGLYVTNPNGGTLVASAGNNFTLDGATVRNAGNGATTLSAGNNLNIGTVTVATSMLGLSTGSRTTVKTTGEVGSSVSSGGNVTLTAGNAVTARQATVGAGGDLGVKAGAGGISIEASRQQTDLTYSANWTDKSTFSSTAHGVQAEGHDNVAVGSSFTGKNVTLDGGSGDVTIKGSYLAAQDKLGIATTGNVSILADQNTSSSSIDLSEHRSPSGLANLLAAPMVVESVGAGIPNPVAGTLLTNRDITQSADKSSTTAVGSLLSAGRVSIQSGGSTTIVGSTVVADGDIGIKAGGNLTIANATDTASGTGNSSTHTTGNVGTPLKPSIGHATQNGQAVTSSTTQVGSQIASLHGNVALSSGGTYTQTASSVLALDAGADGKAGNIDITAKNVIINTANDTEVSGQHTQTNQVVVGGAVSIPLYNSAKSINNTVTAIGQTNDSRAQALGAATVGLQGYNAYAQIASGSPLGGKVSVDVSHTQTESMSLNSSSKPVGSTISGAGDVTIKATGAGGDSNIVATAATISGNNVTLSADNAVTLQAAQQTSSQQSTNSSSGQSAGVGWSWGAQNGLTFEGSLSQAKGSGDGSDVTQINTYVNATKAATINSGGNTTLSGAVVSGDKVLANVGGNLDITSLQDTSTATSKQHSAGFDVSVCVYLCAGTPVLAGDVSLAGAHGNGVYASVVEQSGIQAGDGGFNVNVKGSTNLTGGVIATTDVAVDSHLNVFQTGSLTTSNVVNIDSSQAGAYSVSVGYNGSTNNPLGVYTTGVTGGAGIGSTRTGNVSTTYAGISGYSGNAGVRTGDSPNRLMRTWGASSLIDDAVAQASLSAGFTNQLSQFLPAMATALGNALGALTISSGRQSADQPHPSADALVAGDRELSNTFSQALEATDQLTPSERAIVEQAMQQWNSPKVQALVQQAISNPDAYQTTVNNLATAGGDIDLSATSSGTKTSGCVGTVCEIQIGTPPPIYDPRADSWVSGSTGNGTTLPQPSAAMQTLLNSSILFQALVNGLGYFVPNTGNQGVLPDYSVEGQNSTNPAWNSTTTTPSAPPAFPVLTFNEGKPQIGPFQGASSDTVDSINEVISGGRITTEGGSTRNVTQPAGTSQQQDFDELSRGGAMPVPINTSAGPGLLSILPDGTKVIMRPSSTSTKSPTIEIQRPGGGKVLEIRYPK